MKKKVSREEKELFLGKAEVEDSDAQEMIDKIKEGQDAPLTEQIYPERKVDYSDPTSALMLVKGQLRDDDDPLVQFVEIYQPPLLVDRQKFKRHLLQVLETWK